MRARAVRRRRAHRLGRPVPASPVPLLVRMRVAHARSPWCLPPWQPTPLARGSSESRRWCSRAPHPGATLVVRVRLGCTDSCVRPFAHAPRVVRLGLPCARQLCGWNGCGLREGPADGVEEVALANDAVSHPSLNTSSRQTWGKGLRWCASPSRYMLARRCAAPNRLSRSCSSPRTAIRPRVSSGFPRRASSAAACVARGHMPGPPQREGGTTASVSGSWTDTAPSLLSGLEQLRDDIER
jgi:hypothetical protein